uniref:Multivesicular body subunit 12A n=1 Tax=Romanomermis culicivorax TaxID=13658 RepID=A0A915J7F5_ROMCU
MATENPITEICIISDKNRCPPNFTVVSRAYDDSSFDGDLWKDSLFSFSRIYRYVCFSKLVPVNCYTCNVIAEIALVNDKDHVPTGFTPIDYTIDTKEKALRKKILCIRSVPREFAVDAVSDFMILARQKRPPPLYTIAGELEGLLLCYKYGVIPPNFPNLNSPDLTRPTSDSYSSLPYPIHPLTHGSAFGPSTPTSMASPQPQVVDSRSSQLNGIQSATNYGRQSSLSSSVHSTGIEGLPFELNPRIKSTKNKKVLPVIKPLSVDEFDYDFSIESTVLVDGFS